MKKPQRKIKKKKSAPPLFDHRTEAWLRASFAAVRGALLLLRAIERQQTPAWNLQRKRVAKALASFRRASRWGKESLVRPGRSARRR